MVQTTNTIINVQFKIKFDKKINLKFKKKIYCLLY